ncbi:MAG: dockerin type I repeat-containing protein [Planctomycetota bacterium]
MQLKHLLFAVLLAICPVLTICSGVSAGEFRRGDVNPDGVPDVSDAVRLLIYLFQGGASLDCQDAADVEDSGELDITDAIALLGFLFQGYEPPPAPGGDCGEDLTVDDLECSDYPACRIEYVPLFSPRPSWSPRFSWKQRTHWSRASQIVRGIATRERISFLRTITTCRSTGSIEPPGLRSSIRLDVAETESRSTSPVFGS